jgi:hypothetical protein
VPTTTADIEGVFARLGRQCVDHSVTQWLQHGFHECIVGDPVATRLAVPEFDLCSVIYGHVSLKESEV